ncbi:MAG: ferredoxin [Thermoproteota archaeon]|nr:MAG: ferredoxin [Candidatus Korarchaeota archaeon]
MALGDVIIPVSLPAEGALGRTGSWRVFRPVLDREKCVKCWLCWLYCPEEVISVGEDGYPEIDYEYCKGCLICASVCPRDAIRSEEEVVGGGE